MALQTVPMILQGGIGIRSRPMKSEELVDVLGLEAERRPPPVSVFGARYVILNRKTVRAHFESKDGSGKREVLSWTTPNICEIKAVD